MSNDASREISPEDWQQSTDILAAIKKSVHRVVVGQDKMINRLMIGLLADGHILLEGAPGLAKTLTVRSLAAALSLPFSRIQFTPDLLPADLIGTEIYNPKTGDFSTRQGPIFSSIVLADEINRAPPKVQSALLEAMQERQVTIGTESFQLPKPFLVLATQNPVEQEGTYPLPEAQADRFLMKVHVDYPSRDTERALLERQISLSDVQAVASAQDLDLCRRVMSQIRIDGIILDYIVDLVRTSRDKSSAVFAKWVDFGASPRASLALVSASKAYALLEGRSFVMPDDIKAIIFDVLRHRILPTFEAEAEGVSIDDIILQILQRVHSP